MEYIIKSANKRVSGIGATPKESYSNNSAAGSLETVAMGTKKEPARSAVQVQEQAVSVLPDSKVENIQQEPIRNSWQTVLEILSEESGVEKQDLGDDVNLADIGIDSLLSLVICGRLRDDLDVDLPDGALFQECLTIADIKRRVPGVENSTTCGSSSPPLSEVSSEARVISLEDSNSSSSSTLDRDDSDLSSPSEWVSSESPVTPPVFFQDVNRSLDEELHRTRNSKDTKSPQVATVELEVSQDSIKPAWALHLQGSRKRSTSTLFLLPDGCGAATSYMDLPAISNTLAVVGFNCPFMKTPHLMYDYTLSQVLECYLAGIRSRQPHGPYHLGGWSAGGILAYALAAELLAAGETVASLTLIDSPPPDRGLDHLPERFFTHCMRVGIFGTEMARGQSAAAPDWLLPHFRATIDLLHDYYAPSLPTRNKSVLDMKVSIIWAADCALDGVRYPKLPPREGTDAEDEEGVKFLSEPRVDFGPGHWADLFPPGVQITTSTIEGEHHFSMMRGVGAEKLAHIIRGATGNT